MNVHPAPVKMVGYVPTVSILIFVIAKKTIGISHMGRQLIILSRVVLSFRICTESVSGRQVAIDQIIEGP